jgi:hypothetical protein
MGWFIDRMDPRLKLGKNSSEWCNMTYGTDAFLFLAGTPGASPASWETLCPDVRGVILSKLSLHELACAAQSSREFRQAYLSRMAEERDTLLSIGEQTFGKEVFSGFVGALRRILAGLEPHPGVQPGYCLMVDAAGELESVARHPDYWETYAGWRGCVRHLCPPTFAPDVYVAERYITQLYVMHPGSPEPVDMVGIRVTFREEGLLLIAIANEEVVGMSILLAMLWPEVEETQGSWRHRPIRMHIDEKGFGNPASPITDAARKSEGRDLTGPLRSLAHTFHTDFC